MNQNQIQSKPEGAEQPSPEGLSSSALFGVWYPGPETGGGGTAGPATEKNPGGTWWDGDCLFVVVNVLSNKTGEEWTEYHAVQIVCDEESFWVKGLGGDEDMGWGPECWAWWMRIPSLPNSFSASWDATGS
jgi:hypothetical protein